LSGLDSTGRPHTFLRFYFSALLLGWTGIVIFFLLWNLAAYKKASRDDLLTFARTHCEKIALYCRWNADHGGVYVPVTPQTTPNPYLQVQERDLRTPSGRLLTLLNPAYMTRQVYDLFPKQHTVAGHIISSKPLRPENAPDSWEAQALQAFDQGTTEVSSVEEIGGEYYLRLMRPLRVDGACLKCHAAQGCKIGDLRGGICINVAMASWQAAWQLHIIYSSLAHGLLWLTGTVLICLGGRRLRKGIRLREQAEENLRRANTDLQQRTAELARSNEALQVQVQERGQIEETLREQERFLASIFDGILDGVTVQDTDFNILRANPTAERWFADAAPLAGKKCYEAKHGKDKPCEDCPVVKTLESGQASRSIKPKRMNDAETGWVEIYVYPLVETDSGKVNGVIEYVRDITEQKKTEAALNDNERFLASIFDSIQDGLTVLDNDYNIVRVNPAMERAYQHAMPLAGKKCYEAYHYRHQPCELCPSRRTLETGQAAHEIVVERNPEGELVRYIDLHTFPLLDSDGGGLKGVVENVRDVTEQKQAAEALRQSEEQLRHAMKMEAVGCLAGGVAHDFNNIMTAIIGYSEMLLMDLKDQDPHRQDVQDILQAAERAASLTRQLLAFSRKQLLQPQIVNLNDVVANMDKMLRRIINEDIDLITVLAPHLGTVRADPGQIEQVVLNLAINARDAMPQGGKLTLETANLDLGEFYAQRHVQVTPGPYVMLALSDTGEGMDDEAKARIFEPFFTTKEQGKGTGLGLSIVYGIVKQSGGFIWVYSEVGEGTTFKIYLPRLDQPSSETDLSEASCASDQGSETILLVEDEPQVRQVAHRMLQQHGYVVLIAGDGQEALHLSRHYSGPIHLMLTDVIMPGMSGHEIMQHLRQERPEMKVLYMSGHTENAIVHHGVLDPGIAFMQKPFRHEELMHKVLEVLQSPSSPPSSSSGT
jgi:two-component system, cell cycle sensor histidine kinase and response regulator CckA